ncbi:GDP-L-fucose synthase [Candidatus Pacearchaeota archaeon]|nr:GDP-L-fucose synthase [Candidatus Pacearchaeota archaeon]
MEKTSKIYVAGHNGLAGYAIVKELKANGYHNLVYKTRDELNLKNLEEVEKFFKNQRPEYVFIAAAKVGGIKANKEKKAEFIYDNLQIQNNLIHLSWKYNVKKLLFLASNCMYPKESLQPIKEEFFLTGAPEPTNDAFAVAKIAGVKMCQAYNQQYGCKFISVVPSSLYGENDNFDLKSCHLLPALIRRFHEAKLRKSNIIELWGSGRPKRELMYARDLARALIFLMRNYETTQLINIGPGQDKSVEEIANIVKEIVGFDGEIVFDKTKPDGVFRKLLDTTKIKDLGWTPKTDLKTGIKKTYDWFKINYASLQNL